MVKTWDISAGLCKASLQTPAGDNTWRDVRLIDDRLIVVWCEDDEIYVWGTIKDNPPKIVAAVSPGLQGLRISGDGSKVFFLLEESIEAWSIHTGELVGEVMLELEEGFYLDPLQMDGSKIWIRLKDSSTLGWDFGASDSPVLLSNGPAEKPLLDFIGGTFWQTRGPALVKNTITGKEVFPLSGRYVVSEDIEWDGWYLAAGYQSGEVLIMDFHHLSSQ